MRLRNLAALALALAVLSTAAPAAAQDGGPVYIVQPGDTLTGIAQTFGTTVEALASANGIADPSALFPGTALVIPGFAGVSGVLTAHEVAYGETLDSLALRFGLSVEGLVRLNRAVHPDRIYAGQRLIVPQPEQGQGVAAAIVRPAEPGAGALLAAARLGENPWTLAGSIGRLWLLPGEPLALPGGSAPPSALPEPITALTVGPLPAVQGRMLIVRVELAGPARLRGALGDRPLSFHALDAGTQVALQGVHAMAEPGLYDLELRLLEDDAAGGAAYAFVQPLRVIAGGYPNDPPLAVPPETIDPASTGPEDELVRSLVTQVTPERLWQGPFGYPSAYTEAFPSRFGSRRNYNNTGYNYYHTGLDFYGGTGTPIPAPARGRVVYAGLLTVRGNTTFIDHGWGVFTGYLHQSELLVATGDMVEAGQTIGLVGATGRVTGPHLHFEVWVGGVPVDPLLWFGVEIP